MSKKLELKLENIGLIKEANIDISGLTVIAGKNNTGKSTVGKALMAVIKARNMADIELDGEGLNNIELLRKKNLNKMMKLIFDSEISRNGKFFFSVNGKEHYAVDIKLHKCENFNADTRMAKEKEFLDCVFIQTPLMWDLIDFFDSVLRMRQNSSIYSNNSKQLEVRYPYLLWDLYTQISDEDYLYSEDMEEYIMDDIKSQIIKIMGGRFIKEQGKSYRFYLASGKSISLNNTAIGIKSWGIIQLLLDRNRFKQQRYFVFDEPENHLHPTWQIEFAKVLVALANNGIRIMVNTHSPYMLEGLRTYGNEINDKIKFYIADDHTIKQINGNNDETLDEIFDKLHQAFIILEKKEFK